MIWNFNPFLRGSESCQKSRAKNIGKFLSVLDALGTKSENFRPSTNNLEQTENNTDSFSVDLMFGNIFIEKCYKHYVLNGGAGVG